MSDKSGLLEGLRIDRSEAPAERRQWLPWAAAATVLLLLLAVAAWALLRQDPIPEVRVVTASAPGAAAGSTVLEASGYVIARRQATVSSRIAGQVTEVLVEEGMRVEADDVMARLDDSRQRAQLRLAEAQLAAEQARLPELRVQLADAQRTLARNEELNRRGTLSQSALDQARTAVETLQAQLASAGEAVRVAQRNVEVAQQDLADTIVRAPFSGVVTVKAAQVGESLSPFTAGGEFTRTGVATLVDMDSLEIEVDVSENYINRVRQGQPARARLNAYPEWRFPTEVIAVIPAADRSRATVRVRLAILEPDARILPDMGVRISFLTEDSGDTAERPRPSIPASAVYDENGTSVAYIIRNGHVERRALTLGATRGEQVQVIAGLSGGERLALGDLSRLSDGARIRLRQEP